MGIAVAAAGSLLGGLAGNALMPKKKAMGPDTSIPGITSANVKEGGKNGEGAINVAQVDPNTAINYFKKAAADMKDYSLQGLSLYNDAMGKAINEIRPYADAGMQATNEYMRMVGLKDLDGNAGYTGAQATARLEDTPGYQFQLQQGIQATARNALASGGISANTLAATQNYGQQLAQGTFQNHLSNLGGLMTQGASASNNISNLYGQGGTNALNTMQNIGSAYFNSGIQSGNTWYQAAVANMQAQNAAMSQERAQNAQMAQQAVASGPGYMNASTNAAQFQYGVFQNQQGGQQFYGKSTGWPTYNPNSNSWSV